MKQLTPVLDFLSECFDKWDSSIITSEQYVVITNSYVMFLKKILNISMFVPAKLVDDIWVVLEKPSENMWTDYINSLESRFDDSYTYCFEYDLAQQNVLFKDFEMFRGKPYNNKMQRCYSVDDWWTIEHIIHWRLELTKNAQKKLEL